MKIEAGKFYKTRDGRTVGPMRLHYGYNCETHPWKSDDTRTYMDSGKYDYYDHPDHVDDLISPAHPEQGTLKEIGAKPGDVVELVESGDGDFIGDVGTYDGENVVCNDWSGKHWQGEDGPYGHRWRIISHASETPTSPVRTVTTTRQEIVPGVYGRVAIEACDEDWVDMHMTFRDGQKAGRGVRLTADELTAAIKTLTEILGALQNNP